MDQNILLAYAALLSMALFPIYVGCHRSLSLKGITEGKDSKIVIGKKDENVESMTAKDAWMFPFIGSGVLFGLYLLFKMFSKEYINLVLTAYFLIFGILALGSAISPTVGKYLSSISFTKKSWDFSFTPFWSKEKFPLEFTGSDVVSLFMAIGVGAWYVVSKHWISNNILGLAFSIQGIALLSLGSYQIGCILLGGLFFYDIFWVFGTDVMVTVAKSFDAPVKLLWPKDILAENLEFSMLGLGDIVIPGIFIALLLRFDADQALKKSGPFNKTYFKATFMGYIGGLVSTILVMHTFKAAQPALLYLVPACIGVSLVVAVSKGELKDLLNYSDESETAKKNK